ncbi:MAG: RloB domain-containing protein [Candidatus Methanomethylophilaceae archaeon]|nr:RloB domain-containing protein [Candidatus Methanomethylophilaceae archaeon]
MTLMRMIPNVFILVEGKTEEIYINHLKVRGSNYSLHVERFNGNQPMKMVKRCIARFKEKGMSKKDGDLAFCVLDVDDNTVDELIDANDYAVRHGVRMIISNPCFEVFFLLHYVEKVQMKTCKELKSDLTGYIKGYTETKDCWHILHNKKNRAVERARAFRGLDDIKDGNPGTNIWLLFDELLELSKNR